MVVAKGGGEYRIIDRAFPIQGVKHLCLLPNLLTRMKGSVPSGYCSQYRVKLPGLMGSMFFDLREKFRFLNQVVPLMGVVRVVVKFFRTIIVMDIAIPFGTDAVVPRAETGACHIGPLRPRVLKKSCQGVPLQLFILLQSCHLQKRGVYIQ